ncbi:MAG: hypothetical protein IKS10_05825 [Lachnospiraceae bacterium]|nr:hypothetical protein [Lachnospiraceae bacterium]
MASFYVSDISYEDTYAAFGDHSDVMYVSRKSSNTTQGVDGKYAYTSWYYYDEEEEDSSSSHPVLWVIGGMILGALLMGLVLLILRKRRKNDSPLVVTETPTRDDLLRQRAIASSSLLQEKTNHSVASRSQIGSGASDYEENHSVEVCRADTIPGETMEMLATRLQGCLGREGIRTDLTDVGRILAAYACNGGVRIVGDRDTHPMMLTRASKALSEFFCVSLPGSAEPAADFLPADASVPLSFRTKISMTRLEQSDQGSFGGMNRDVFRGILRETEEEYYLPEEEWNRVDVLLDRYTKDWISPARHLMIRNMENITTCLLAVGASPDEALDYAIYQALLLRVNRKNSRRTMITLGEAFNEQFREREMPLCQGFLADYLPVTHETETPEPKNQTIHGGEYEPN